MEPFGEGENAIKNHAANDDKDALKPTDDAEQPIYEWEEEGFWEEEDEDEEERERQAEKRRKWIRRTLAGLLAVMLFGNLIAFLPQIYSLPAIRFLQKNNELSQKEQIRQYKQAVVGVNTDGSKGTGFNIDETGLIITNQHVIDRMQVGTVSFLRGDIYAADVVFSDPAIDTAILKIRGDHDDLPTLELETESQWQAGDSVYVVGNPLSFYQIANEGVILGLTSLTGWDLPVMMIDAPIYKGNSGSPVINGNGKVIAVVFATSKIEREEESINVGLAVPVEHMREYIEEQF
ncbi:MULTISPECIES: S1C family serine protease [unclassified Paenibacillus]|uniref:S1C family serine protease n=1 Tax=unclassified Paenibacillus TaxID=185978 RepID=UPI001C11B18B|nr:MULTISPECIES: serine protease [unclassified Paenibacillus]MBU5443421.1 serine protease [Paenibacillus sp. MSJ-34]CAH0122450.1 hypothetical protein PAE9249_05001 [Paenibacillus sp. CECT 9249]